MPITITSPSSGTTVSNPITVTGSDGPVSYYIILNNTTNGQQRVDGEAGLPGPFEFTLPNLTAGSYTITVYRTGNSSSSIKIKVT